MGSVGWPCVQFILQRNQWSNVAKAFVTSGKSEVLNMDDRQLAEGIAAFGNQYPVFISLPPIGAENFDDLYDGWFYILAIPR